MKIFVIARTLLFLLDICWSHFIQKELWQMKKLELDRIKICQTTTLSHIMLPLLLFLNLIKVIKSEIIVRHNWKDFIETVFKVWNCIYFKIVEAFSGPENVNYLPLYSPESLKAVCDYLTITMQSFEAGRIRACLVSTAGSFALPGPLWCRSEVIVNEQLSMLLQNPVGVILQSLMYLIFHSLWNKLCYIVFATDGKLGKHWEWWSHDLITVQTVIFVYGSFGLQTQQYRYQTSSHTCMHTYNTYAQSHPHTHPQIHTHTHMHACTRTHTCAHTCTPPQRHMHANMHTWVHPPNVCIHITWSALSEPFCSWSEASPGEFIQLQLLVNLALLPCCSIEELVKPGISGLLFDDSEQLAQQLQVIAVYHCLYYTSALDLVYCTDAYFSVVKS